MTVPTTAVARPMVVDDVERVVRIEAASFTSPWRADTFHTLIERPGAELWVLDSDEDGVIGYAVVWCILDQGELANIAIAEGHRGKGLGAYLLQKVMDVAQERGVESMYLEVRVSNTRAAELYRRFGFVEVGMRKRYYEAPREDALVMVARL